VTLHKLKDVEELSQGLPLGELSLSSDALHPDVWQAYILAASKQGYDVSKLRGVGGGIFYYVPAVLPSKMDCLCVDGRYSTLARWSNDFIEYVVKGLPKWNIWFTSSYDFREAGGNAIHELAFTMAVRDELLREMKRRGVEIPPLAARLSPVFGSDRDFFEEVAKFRAARRMWARTLKECWGVTDPQDLCLRFHVDVSGYNYTRQQPLVNIARGTLGSLAAVLGGTMGIQNPSYDEGWCTPTEEAVRVAIRSQQVIRYESGVARVADPLAGSYYVEWLTSKLEEEATNMAAKIEDMGGWLAALQSGWIHKELEKSFLETQRKVESGERTVIGVNRFNIPPEDDFKPRMYQPDTSDVERYLAEHRQHREKRDNRATGQALEDLRRAAAKKGESLVPGAFAALEAGATFSEIIGVMRMNDGMEFDWAGEREYPYPNAVHA